MRFDPEVGGDKRGVAGAAPTGGRPEPAAARGSTAALKEPTPLLIADNSALIHGCLVVTLAAAAIAMRVVALGEPFGTNEYDEGVYWQSLRAMGAGHHLYADIFNSQPPLFLLSIYPFYASLGSTIVAARAGVAALSVLGLVGAYLAGRALGGRWGGVIALCILTVAPMYLRESHILQADAPATALLFLTIGLALLWRARPTGRRGMVLAVLCGTALSAGLFIKLLDVAILAPLSVLIFERASDIRREARSHDWTSWLPIGAGWAAAVVAALGITVAFWGAWDAFLRQTVTFHLAAESVAVSPPNIDMLRHFLSENLFLGTAAVVGLVVAALRRDARAIALVAWLLATLLILAIHVPLHPQHPIVLLPPLIAAIALGFADLPAGAFRRPISSRHAVALLMGVLIIATVASGVRGDRDDYRGLKDQAASPATLLSAAIATDIARAITPDQHIITDAPFAAALANRDVPPWLVDTSFTRLQSGYLTDSELLKAATDPRVHAVLFATGRLSALPTTGFHDWVVGHFALVRRYRDGIELWSR